MISKEEAEKLEAELIKELQPHRTITGAKVGNETPKGVCYICGSKIAKTETICGECACEEEGCE